MHAPTGRPLSAHSEKDFETQHRYYESQYACDITLLICNVYILNNLFTAYTNNVCATFLPFFKSLGNVMLGGCVTTGCSCFLVNA